MEFTLSPSNTLAISSSVQPELQAFASKVIASKPVYIDTETTGLEKSDEIIEISVIDFDGSLLMESLVKPLSQIPTEATRIHGIGNFEVATAPTWPIVWSKVRGFLFGRIIAAYNSTFDLRMMQQSHNRYRLPWRESFEWFDVMTLFSQYRGVWDPDKKSMRYFSLKDAGNYFKIDLPNSHRSTADSLLTRAVLHTIAGIPF